MSCELTGTRGRDWGQVGGSPLSLMSKYLELNGERELLIGAEARQKFFFESHESVL